MASKGSIWASIGLKTDEFKKSLTDLQIKTKSTGSKLSSALSSINPITVGITAGIAGIGAAFGSVISTVKDFEQGIADLGAITGATGENLEKFKDEVLRVSESTGKGATDIAKAFQIVGSAQPELLKSADALGAVTEAAVLLSKAGNIDVPAAAASLTLAMNQYGASSAEAANYTDILASSQQMGTATIIQLSESLKNVGSVAKSSGLSFETTNAALQGLAKGGLVGAEAGTKLRTILLRLAKTGRDDLNPATQKFSDILDVLKSEITDVTSAQKMFGEEAAAGALTLIAQKDVVEGLDGALLNHGAALEQAEQRYDTIDGKTEKLSATWDRMVLSFEDGGNAIGEAIKTILDFVTETIDGITRLSKSFTQLEVEKVNKKFNEFKKSGVEAATDVKNSLEKLGLKGDDLTEALNRALIRARENFKLAKERGDLNMAASYAAERDALKEMVTEKKKDNSVTEESVELTKEQIKAIEDRNKAIQNALKDDAEEIEIPISGFVLEGDKEDIWGDIKADIPLEIDTDKLDKDLDVVNEKFDAMRERVIASGQAINNALMGVAQGGLEAIGASIGEAMAGGEGFASIAMTFAQTIADAVGSLGQQLIQIGITMTGIQKALSTVGFANPALLIGGGIALVALSQMMKTSMAKPVGFADGGLVTGSVFANIGEGIGTTSANPEVIAPLNKLKDFMPSGDGGMGGNVKFRIEGNTLVGILQRQEKTSKYSR